MSNDPKRKDWIVSIPDQSGFEWFETREVAEAYAVEAMTDILHDHGEALDGQAFVAVIVTHVCEVVDEDPSEDVAEELRGRGLDYFVSGYRGRESAFMAKMAEERAEAVAALETEIASAGRWVARYVTGGDECDGCVGEA